MVKPKYGEEGKLLYGYRQFQCVIKRKLKFENYKNCLEVPQLENKINHLVINNS